MSDHKEIWLQPKCCVDDEFEDRCWCVDSFDDCEDDEVGTRYVRADIYEKLEAQLKKFNLLVLEGRVTIKGVTIEEAKELVGDV